MNSLPCGASAAAAGAAFSGGPACDAHTVFAPSGGAFRPSLPACKPFKNQPLKVAPSQVDAGTGPGGGGGGGNRVGAAASAAFGPATKKCIKTYKVNRRRPKVHSPSVEEEAGGSASFRLGLACTSHTMQNYSLPACRKHRLPAVAARALRQARQPSPGLCLHNSHQAELQPSGLQKHRLPAVAALPARGLAGTTPIPNC